MTGFRMVVVAALALVGLPLLVPLASAALDPRAWLALTEFDRLGSLLWTTAQLAGLTWLLAVPLGSLLGLVLFRCDVPAKRLWLGLLMLALFVPLPIVATAWQAVLTLGRWGIWSHGLLPAAFIHAAAAIPWVVLLVGLGCRNVERELEEDALLAGPWAFVVWRVTLPRAGLSLVAASLWVVLQTATEITVSDLFAVRTAAEEVYTQMVVPETEPGEAVRRATLAALPSTLILTLAVAWLAAAVVGRMPSRERVLAGPLSIPLGRWRWPCSVVVAGLCGVLLGVPLVALVVRAATPTGGAMSLAFAVEQVRLIWVTEVGLIGQSLLVAVVAASLATGLALAASVAGRDSTWVTRVVLVLAALAWAMPGPLVGQGYRDLVTALLDATGSPEPLARWLWYGPSPVPLIAVDVVRFLPFALALVWPAVQAIPRGLIETATLDGLGTVGLVREVVWPLVARSVASCWLAVAVLTLGELAASKRVSTPGFPAYAETIFTQMHYGITADLAMRCLMLLAVALVGGWVWLRAYTAPGAGPIS